MSVDHKAEAITCFLFLKQFGRNTHWQVTNSQPDKILIAFLLHHRKKKKKLNENSVSYECEIAFIFKRFEFS